MGSGDNILSREMGNKIPSNGSLGCTVGDKITRILWCYFGSIFFVYVYFSSVL